MNTFFNFILIGLQLVFLSTDSAIKRPTLAISEPQINPVICDVSIFISLQK